MLFWQLRGYHAIACPLVWVMTPLGFANNLPSCLPEDDPTIPWDVEPPENFMLPTENRGIPSGWFGGRSCGYFFGLRTRPQAGNIRATRLERARYRSSPSNPTRKYERPVSKHPCG